MLYLTSCFITLIILVITGLTLDTIAWFYWPRLSRMREMQDPIIKAETELNLMQKTLVIEQQRTAIMHQRTEIDLMRLKVISKDEAIFDAGMSILHQNHVALLAAPQTDTTAMLQTIDPLPLLLRALHLMVIGFSDGGKTTLLHHLASTWRQSQRVLILDFDYGNGMWPNCDIYTEPRVEEFCQTLNNEFEIRQRMRQSGERTQFDSWRIIIDEYSAVANNKQITSIIELLLRRGRKYALNVVVGIQDNQVKSLGWEGKGALRTNFTYTVEAKVNSTNRQRTLTLIANEGEPINCLTPHLPNPEENIKAVHRHENTVPIPSTAVPLGLYTGTDKEIAKYIIEGKSKTFVRENVKGSNASIGQRYDEIKAELYPEPIVWDMRKQL